MGGRPGGLGATHTVFAHNIVQGGAEAAIIEGPYPDAEWRDNILWHTSPGAMPRGTYELTDPRLVADPSGIRRPGPGSPALDRGHRDPLPEPVDPGATAPLTPEALLRLIRDPR
jgi:hypothetical protein